MCERVIAKGDAYEDLKANLSVEVNITEASALGSYDNETCFNMKASLEPMGTEIILPSPILIIFIAP